MPTAAQIVTGGRGHAATYYDTLTPAQQLEYVRAINKANEAANKAAYDKYVQDAKNKSALDAARATYYNKTGKYGTIKASDTNVSPYAAGQTELENILAGKFSTKKMLLFGGIAVALIIAYKY